MELHHIAQARRSLTSCGFMHTDRSGLYVPLEKKFLLPMVLQPNQTAVFTKEVTGKTVWALRAISSDQGLATVTGVRLQIQLPSGRFLFGGNGIDVGQFAWVGSYRYWLSDEQDIEPGGKLSITLTDTNAGGLGSALAVNLLFEGCYKYYYRGQGNNGGLTLASSVPRYQGIVNENVLAPCWMAGYGPATPPGFQDDFFVYSSSTVAIPLTGPLSTTAEIPIDNGLDFVMGRILVDLEPDATVTAGNVLIRLRTGDGYALMDDYLDVAKYLAGAEWLGNWKIRGGDQIVADIALVDSAGSGNMNVNIHLEGVKRRAL